MYRKYSSAVEMNTVAGLFSWSRIMMYAKTQAKT
jgi:hypothetical protein